MARIVVAGAGVAGLGVALFASRAGHEVELFERDDTPLPPSAPEAFWWDRRGAPQVRHSHAFLARLRNLLRDRHPDVLAALLEAGATEMDFIEMLPEGMDRAPVPGDEDLVAIACRRTTFEWVLRRIVAEEGRVELHHGDPAVGLVGTAGPMPLVDGLQLASGSTAQGDLTVLAGGRRMDVPALLAPLGVEVPEETEDTGIIYLSRFFRLHDGADYPPQLGPIGGDLGYLKYGVFPGDDRTFSVTLAVQTHDTELRRLLLDPAAFLAVAAQLPATSAHVDGRAQAITEVEVMGGLINRRRFFVHPDGSPRACGVVAVGDAHTATNPLYGRGCSLALVQAAALVDSIDAHGEPADLEGGTPLGEAVLRAYETASEAEVLPWYRAAVAQDRMNRSTAGSPADGDGSTGTVAHDTAAEATQAEFVRSLLRDGLLPAVRVDPVVLRAFLRMMNLLSAPDALMNDPDVIGRVMRVYQERDERPPEPPLGPERDDLISAVS